MPRTLSIRGAVEHNLKGVDLDLPHNSLVVLCGVSGSGKSSLAFDTVYAEAQRRFHAALDSIGGRSGSRLRQPRVDSIEGLAPPMAIDQAGVRADPRSTAGTASGTYEYFRLLFARMGQPLCPACGAAVIVHRFEEVYERAAGLLEGTRLIILAPVKVEGSGAGRGGKLERIERSGFGRLRVGSDFVQMDEVDPGCIETGSMVEVVVDRLVVKPDALVRLKGSLEAAVELSGGRLTLVRADDDAQADMKFSTQPTCSDCGAPFEPITPGLFSFSSPRGACSQCRGTGVQAGMEFDHFFPDQSQILDEALSPLWSEFGHEELSDHIVLQCERIGVDPQQPIGEWPADKAAKFWKAGRARATGGAPTGSNSGRSARKGATFPGLRRWLERRAALAEGDELTWMEERLGERPCPQCEGSRLSMHSMSVWLGEETIASLMSQPVSVTLGFLRNLEFPESRRPMGETIVHHTAHRLETIEALGLGYLALDRPAATLSSGELQRLRLAAALGSDMTGMLYVLDEPSVGLHARDADRLAGALMRLRDQGNTLLVVEHDLSILHCADYLVEMGPGAGVEGGEVITKGTPGEVAKASSSTARYLRGEPHAAATRRRPPGAHGWLELKGATGHNLKGIDVAVPLQCLVVVSGVSGSGKSSLVHGTLYRAVAARLHKAQQPPLPFSTCTGFEQIGSVMAVDQKSIGRSARSNAASYSGLLTYIRRLYAKLPEARLRGYKPAHFSFNVPGQGACGQCGGTGLGPRPHGQFESLAQPCATCSGQRFKTEILDIRFRQASIVDVLGMSVSEALALFEAIPQIERRLHMLSDLGLGYLVLGQPASSLSGGEAQRLKLIAELSRSLDTKILYILDEPTTGLHIRDVEYLIELLQLLVDGGHTVVVVEHDLDVIRCADYVIDIGPESGEDGGHIVAAGPPDEIAATPGSHTGRYLADQGSRWQMKKAT